MSISELMIGNLTDPQVILLSAITVLTYVVVLTTAVYLTDALLQWRQTRARSEEEPCQAMYRNKQ